MNDERLMLFQRHSASKNDAMRVHELDARLSADGRNLVISRYSEHYRPGDAGARHQVSRSIPIALLLRWMAKVQLENKPARPL
ncbi:hypothetical protein [Pseudomonas putida]|uniref:hypothetical protein n=1 Tax=Pseudomonas putida TaxID=303 RepID=UPI000819226E|nr:hypothetical protein [Pseudomonas putida]OCT29729.1 hypothetical protein A6E20_04775 [Pseudomonas putida]OCT31426.1 hypothetical protein A6E23_02530 [Pseudomonas putida]OCT33668.1 hypothetical protein A6E24_01715 [Pseudomonas putida]OCT40114.1 hypothetical protein A6E19_01720 [Pseudomonas putida]